MQSFSYSFRLNGSSIDHFTIEWLISCVSFTLLSIFVAFVV